MHGVITVIDVLCLFSKCTLYLHNVENFLFGIKKYIITSSI